MNTLFIPASFNSPGLESVRFARFIGLKDPKPKMQSLPLEGFMSLFEQRKLVPDKHMGTPWSPTVYADGASRKSANVEAITALVVDVDDGTPFATLKERLEPFLYVVHTSHSHTEAHPKYRVVLPLTAPVPAVEWESVWQRMNLLVDGHADPATKDPARIYFLPSMAPGAVGHFSERHEGKLITVEDLPVLPVQPVYPLVPMRKGAAGAKTMDADELGQYEGEQRELREMCKRCHFIRWAAHPQNQNQVPEPLWMAMLSNVSRYRGGREFAHEASRYHDEYSPEETDERLVRHREQSGPITCNWIRAQGFKGCPNGGCVLPSGVPTAAPAGLGTWPEYFDHKTIPHPIILRSFVTSVFPDGFIYANGEFYSYWQGAYDMLDATAEVKHRLSAFLGFSATAPFLNSLHDLLAIQQAWTTAEFAPNLNYLCLTNGTLNLRTGQLEAHSPNHRLKTRLEVPWDQDAKCPKFLAYLESVFEGDEDKEVKITFIRQWMGYLLVPDASQQKMVWLVGAGANGKSVLLDIIRALVRPENVSNAMMDTFHISHVRAELQGKLVNISSEIAADSMINDGYVKAIVAGDTLEASRKYKPSFSFRPVVRLMAATNNLPRTNDLSHGFFRRTIIVPFNRKFADHEQNPNLVKELLEELPGILVWAVEGLHQVREQGRFTIPPSSVEAGEEYRLEANPVQLFAQECLVASTTNRISNKSLHDLYEAWCQENGFKSCNPATLGKRLGELGFAAVKSNGFRGRKVVPTPLGEDLARNHGVGGIGRGAESSTVDHVAATRDLARSYIV